jgi:tRNA (cmo5U34)-methyltransferase
LAEGETMAQARVDAEPVKTAGRKQRDRLFKSQGKVGDFTFNAQTAGVFDDMLERSVPFYSELQQMVGEVAAYCAQKDTRIYDLGCSTGTTLMAMMQAVRDPSVEFVGIDNSPPMLDRARQKIAQAQGKRKLSLVEADLNKMDFEIANASVVTMNWTLQFVRPLYREALLKKICHGLVKNGVLVLCEKVLVEPSLLNRLYIELYYNFKRRHGYSELEIAKKREALENVLIPYRVDENLLLLQKCGFRATDTPFRWYNWSAFIAFKL